MNNPPAFPHVADILQVQGDSAFVKTLTQNGMTLRDYMAAKAMQGLMGRVWGDKPAEELFNIWATSSYALADAMLKAREA
jgi:hypothetical protein